MLFYELTNRKCLLSKCIIEELDLIENYIYFIEYFLLYVP